MRRLHRQRRERIDALHRSERAFDASGPDLWPVATERLAELPNPCERGVSYTLDKALTEALFARGITQPRDAIYWLARMHATAALEREPLLTIAAAYAVERVLDPTLHSGFFDHHVRDFWRNGEAYSVGGHPVLEPVEPGSWRPTKPNDWQAAGLLSLPAGKMAGLAEASWREVVRTKTLPATWQPEVSKQGPPDSWRSDPLRVPAEALMLVEAGLRYREFQQLPGDEGRAEIAGSVLLLNLGLTASAQLLSALMPEVDVWPGKEPFSHPPMPVASTTTWKALVIGIPSFAAWRTAEMLGDPASRTFLQRRRARQVDLRPNYSHLPRIVRQLRKYRQPGQLVVPIGPPWEHAAFVGAMKAETDLRPFAVGPLDTSERGVWVRHDRAPGYELSALRGFGPLVSFWEVP